MTQAEELKSLVGGEAQRRAWLEEVGALLPASHCERIGRILDLVGWLLALLEVKNLSIAKLRQLCFGSQTESARNVCHTPPKEKQKAKTKGHGRNSHRCYTGARRVRVAHPALRAGQTCPDCGRGKLRPRKEPAVAIQVKAQPPVGAVIHELEQLRCDTCGKMFTAPTPSEAGVEKYDPSVGVMVGLMRYGSGMPFYRLERLQRSLGVPLPSSVQWEQVDRAARALEPVLDQLIYLAAQSAAVFNDDTTMRVGALRKEIQAEANSKRTGIFTSGIVSQTENHPIALFFTGRAHAGENLAEVLAHREPQRSPPLHMCDGLAQNTPKGHRTVDCNCNVHARRNFVDIHSSFPEECRRVVESFAEIYRVEAQATADGLSPQERWEVHQAHSQPVMDKLKAWFTQQIDERKVEPNSGLGQAIAYMQERWTPLTQFLRVPGAPLDNNVTERILKMAILHRKNSLFYRTQRGADVGDLFMSLVQTCRANEVNPFDYMLAVVRNAQAAKADAGRWMPWNFRESLVPLANTG
ncbi:MAG: IS66 family transposase [Nitrospiraceae bacterium]